MCTTTNVCVGNDLAARKPAPALHEFAGRARVEMGVVTVQNQVRSATAASVFLAVHDQVVGFGFPLMGWRGIAKRIKSF
jgi:hypothetical protein